MEKMDFFQFHQAIATEENAIKFSRDRGLILKVMKCEHCDLIMSEQRSSVHTSGVCFRCNSCKNRCSIYKSSIFEGGRLPLQKILSILYLDSLQVNQENISLGLGVAKTSVISLLLSVRRLYSVKLSTMDLRIGGDGVTVEVDESVIARAKPARNRSARPVPQKWTLGMFDRCRGVGIIRMIPNRGEETLVTNIKEYCLPGTRIISDGWSGYNNLPMFGYTHDVVVHRDEFIVPNTDIHTNNVENYWKRCKAKFKRMNGANSNVISSYLNEFMWCERFGKTAQQKFENTIILLSTPNPNSQ